MAGEQASRADSVGAWLRNVLLVMVILVVGACGWFVYRLSRIAYGVEKAVVAVSDDLQQVTATVATLSGDVSAIRTEILELKNRAQESIPYEEVEHAFEELQALGAAAKADSTELTPDAEAEIKALLKSLSTSGCTAEVRGDSKSIFTLHARLATKYKLKKKTLKSAEDFIDQVATTTTFGNTYYLVDAPGKRTELAEWLKARLAEIRAEQAP
jgi:prophage DNA circulation protein